MLLTAFIQRATVSSGIREENKTRGAPVAQLVERGRPHGHCHPLSLYHFSCLLFTLSLSNKGEKAKKK